MAESSREIYWSAILADFHRSGLTHVEFCRLRRVSIHSFRDWLYRLRPGLPPRRPRTDRTAPAPSSTQAGTPAFLPVHVLHGPRSAAPIPDHRVAQPPAPLELILSDRAHLRVPAGFDPATLHQLLDVLEQRS
jgi:hypothetical protein